MIVGTGIDIVDINQFEKSVDRYAEKFILRIFTNDEIKFCKSHMNNIRLFAVRFAAKEAVLKAIGTGLRFGISWHDIEIVENKTDRSTINYYRKCQQVIQNIGNVTTHLSISCTISYAVAFVILEQ